LGPFDRRTSAGPLKKVEKNNVGETDPREANAPRRGFHVEPTPWNGSKGCAKKSFTPKKHAFKGGGGILKNPQE